MAGWRTSSLGEGITTIVGPAPLQKCVRDFRCINFGGFCRGFSWRISLGTSSHENEEKNSGEKIRKKIWWPKIKIRKKSVLPKTDPDNCLIEGPRFGGANPMFRVKSFRVESFQRFYRSDPISQRFAERGFSGQGPQVSRESAITGTLCLLATALSPSSLFVCWVIFSVPPLDLPTTQSETWLVAAKVREPHLNPVVCMNRPPLTRVLNENLKPGKLSRTEGWDAVHGPSRQQAMFRTGS